MWYGSQSWTRNNRLEFIIANFPAKVGSVDYSCRAICSQKTSSFKFEKPDVSQWLIAYE